MSNIILAATESPNIPVAVLPIAAAAALAMAAIAGVFQPRRILGPPRLSTGESPRVLAGVIGFALMVWAISGLVINACHQYLSQTGRVATTNPSTFSNAEMVIYSAAVQLALFWTMLVASSLLRQEGTLRIGVGISRIPAGIVGGIFGIVVILPLMFCVDAVTELVENRLHIAHPPHALLNTLQNDPRPWMHAAVIISAVVVAPLAEEMFFRGQLQTLLRYAFKRPWPAVFVASAAFAMLHQRYAWPQIFFLGVGLGYVYERTGNLWVNVVMHSLFNLTSIVLFTRYG
jgi:membrane protease YdiL (CAAX protease family)